jgi:FHA domain
MSFRLFAYYCAICGGWAAFFGWMLGNWILAPVRSSPSGDLTGMDNSSVGLRGLGLGLMVALGLSLLDSFWVFGLNRLTDIALRVVVAIIVGAVGGLVGGVFGSWLYEKWFFFYVIGWTLTGALIGASIGTFDMLWSLINKQDVTNPRRKLIKCLIGGTVGGLVGGVLAWLVGAGFRSPVLSWMFRGKDMFLLWTPTAVGFVVLGACIGLLVALAQIILKEAWVKVEAGFRPGREMILAKESTSVGRAESSDIALFGDSGVERTHCCIVQKGSSYVLEDNDTPGGTYINDVKVVGSAPLKSGDLIKMGGKSLLRFYERPKK